MSDSPYIDIEQHRQEKWSWLASDERFQYIQQFALADKICAFTEDIRSVDTFRALRKIIQDNGIKIDSLYISNISELMHKAENRALCSKHSEHINRGWDLYR